MKNFRSLNIWINAMQLTKDIYKLVLNLPDVEKFGLRSQITRAVVSIPSNIAEGCSRSSDIELARFLEIALGSAFEVETQLIIMKDIYSIQETEIVFEQINSLQKMINAYKIKIKQNPNKPY